MFRGRCEASSFCKVSGEGFPGLKAQAGRLCFTNVEGLSASVLQYADGFPLWVKNPSASDTPRWEGMLQNTLKFILDY